MKETIDIHTHIPCGIGIHLGANNAARRFSHTLTHVSHTRARTHTFMFYFETLRRSRKTLCRPKNRRKRLSQTRTQCGNDCGKVRATLYRPICCETIRDAPPNANKRASSPKRTKRARRRDASSGQIASSSGGNSFGGNIGSEDVFAIRLSSRSLSPRDPRHFKYPPTPAQPEDRSRTWILRRSPTGCRIIPGFVTDVRNHLNDRQTRGFSEDEAKSREDRALNARLSGRLPRLESESRISSALVRWISFPRGRENFSTR